MSRKIGTEQRQIGFVIATEDRNAALSKLGQNLSIATSPKEAARIIGETTRELFGWDLFTLELYFAQDDIVQPIVNIDTVNGQLIEVSNWVPIGPFPASLT